MLKRIKNLWKLGEFKVDETQDQFTQFTGIPKLTRDVPLGDGKAEFIGPGTEEEFNEQERADKGLKGLFGLK